MKKRYAFTLVELLVVIAIIAVLLAILMPALSGIKASGKRLQCANRLSSIGKAFGMYINQYDSLPLLEYHSAKTPWIESTYLVAKRTPPDNQFHWLHLGCLFGDGFIDDGKIFYCPAVDGWLDNYKSQVKTGSDGLTTWANLTYNWNQGPKATKGYCYWPLSKKYATSADISQIGKAPGRYETGLPLNATKQKELMMGRPIATDNKFHSTKISGWLIDCLYPDGHVTYQKQPVKKGVNGYGQQGEYGMYSDEENCQLPDGMTTSTKPVTVSDPDEKGKNLASAVSAANFFFALEP